MIVTSKHKLSIVLAVAILTITISPVGRWSHAKSGGDTLPPLALEQDLEEDFLSLYEKVKSRVEKNELTSQRSAQADKLKREFEKALIRTDARIKILRVDAADAAKGQRADIINQIIRAAQQRERLKMIYLLRMHLLANVSGVDTVVRFQTELPHHEVQPASSNSVSSGPNITIRFKPEDVTTGERE